MAVEWIPISSALNSAINTFGSQVKVKVEVAFTGNGTYYEIPQEFIIGASISDKLENDEGFAVANTASIQLRNPDKRFSVNIFQESFNPSVGAYNGPQQVDGYGNLRPGRKVKLSVSVGEGNEYVERFNGVVDLSGWVERIGTARENIVEVKLNDFAKYCVDAKTQTDSGGPRVYVNYKVSDPASPSTSLVHTLAALAGIGSAQVEATLIDKVIPYYIAEGTVWDELRELAEAYLAILTFTPTGQLFFGESRWEEGWTEDLTAQYAFDNDVYNGLTREDDFGAVKNRIKTSWEEVDKLGRQPLWSFNEDYNSSTGMCNYSIPALDRDLDICNDEVEYAGHYSAQGGEVVCAEDIDDQSAFEASLVYTGGSLDVERYDTTTFPDKAIIRVYNSGPGTAILKKAVIQGSPIVKKKAYVQIEQDGDSQNLYGLKELEIDNKAFADLDHLKAFTAWKRDFLKYPRQVFRLTTYRPIVQALVGSFVSLSETRQGTGISSLLCRVISLDYNLRPNGESTTSLRLKTWLTGWSGSAVYSTIIHTTAGNPDDSASKVLEILGNNFMTHQQHMEGYNDPVVSATTIPSIPSITVAKGVGRNIILSWGKQNNLTNFDKYEVQVSSNTSAWYSLKFDGTDWKDTLDETTSWPNELLVHTLIPYSGTEEAPASTSLWYRVRRTTKAGDSSDWSEMELASTSLVDTGDIASNAIVASKVDVATLNALIANINEYLQVSEDGFLGQAYSGEPTLNDQRSRLDKNELTVERYDGADWEPIVKIGGDENGGFFPWVQARGIAKTGATGEVSALDIGDKTTGKVFEFENTLNDKQSIDPWNSQVGNLAYTGSSRFGDYALTSSSGSAYIQDNDAQGINWTASFILDFWLGLTSAPETASSVVELNQTSYNYVSLENDGNVVNSTTNTSYAGFGRLNESTVFLIPGTGGGASGYVYIGTIAEDGNSITWTNGAAFDSAVATVWATAINTSTIFIAYRKSSACSGIIAVVSGTTVSFGSGSAFAAYDGATGAIGKLSDTKVAIAWVNNADSKGYVRVANVSGTTITYAASANFESGSATMGNIAVLSSAKFAINYADWINPTSYGRTRVATLDASDVTSLSGETTFASTSSNNASYMRCCVLDGSTYVQTFITSGGSYGGPLSAILTTVVDTTATHQTATGIYSQSALWSNIEVISTNQFAIAFQNYTTGKHSMVLGTRSGTTLSFTSIFASAFGIDYLDWYVAVCKVSEKRLVSAFADNSNSNKWTGFVNKLFKQDLSVGVMSTSSQMSAVFTINVEENTPLSAVVGLVGSGYYHISINYDKATSTLFYTVNDSVQSSVLSSYTLTTGNTHSLKLTILDDAIRNRFDDLLVEHNTDKTYENSIDHYWFSQPWANAADWDKDLILVPKAEGKVLIMGGFQLGAGETEYDTGWVSNSDWTGTVLGATVGSTIVHNLNADMMDLDIRIFINESAQFESARLCLPVPDITSVYGGFGCRQVSKNEINLFTAQSGFITLDSVSTYKTWGSSTAGYYRVVVRTTNPTKGATGARGPQGDAGTVVVWDSTTSYLTDQIVSYDGLLYKALQDNINKQPDTETSYWEVVVLYATYK